MNKPLITLVLVLSLVTAGCAQATTDNPPPARIAFKAYLKDKPRSPMIMSMNEDGTGLVELCPWSNTAGNPQQYWSSDRKYLVFVSVEGTGDNATRILSIVDADGSNRRQLVDITGMRIGGGSISPQGETILLTRSDRRVIEIPHEGHIDLETKHPYNIYAVEVDSAEMKQLTDFLDIGAENPVYSPDGKKIAFIGHTADPQTHEDVYVMNADGSNIRRLTDHDGVMIRPGSLLQWSPDSKKVLYDLITVMVDDSTEYDDLFTVDIASGEIVNLTNTDNISEGEPCRSPDGKKIAFIGGGGREWAMYVMDADGRNINKVGDALSQPSWLPDGRRIMALRTVADRVYVLVIIDIDGQNMRTLIQSGDKYTYVSDPVWLGE